MRRLVRGWAVLFVAGLAGAAGGCGSGLYDTATVTGTVMCDGQPAAGGMIRFRPVDAPEETGRPPGEPGREAFATVGKDGTFTLMMDTAADASRDSGALIGRHDVIFEMPRTEPAPIDAEDRAWMSPEQLKELRAELDKKFPVGQPLSCSAEITPNQVEVEAGENVFEFELAPK